MTSTDRLVAKLIAQPWRGEVSLFQGFPPVLTSSKHVREQFPPAAVLLIEAKSSGIFLVRFAADGQFAGDTWHKTIEDAQHQATFEYENLVSDWIVVPPDVEDVGAFALGRN